MKNSGSGNNIVKNQIDNDFKNYRFEDFAKVSRAEARKIGQRVYYGEERCMRGHEPWRYTRNGSCLYCDRRRSGNRAFKAKTDGSCKMLDIDAKKEALALKRQLSEMDL